MRILMSVERNHCAYILQPEFREIGVGTHTGDLKGFDRAVVYTVDFGVRRQ